MPFSRNFTDLILASRILSFLCLFVYVKYFKYAVLIGYFRNLADVVVECLGRLVLFAVLIIVMSARKVGLRSCQKWRCSLSDPFRGHCGSGLNCQA